MIALLRSSSALAFPALLGVPGLAFGMAACGGHGSVDTGSIANSPGSGGSSGASGSGMSADGGGGGTSGGSGGAVSAIGVGGLGGVAGQVGAGGSSSGGVSGGSGQGGAVAHGGQVGAGGAVECESPSPPVWSCYEGGAILCSPPGAGKSLACYAPGEAGAPPSPCLAADDPALVALVDTPCEMFQGLHGSAICVQATSSGATVATPHCCYEADQSFVCV